MTKEELSLKILIRLNDALNSIVSDDGDEPVWNAVTWIVDESNDAHELCHNFKEDGKYCYKCKNFIEYGKTPFKSDCILNNLRNVRYLSTCPVFEETE